MEAKILKALLRTNELNYQQVVDLGFRRKNVRKHLDQFMEQGLVTENAENWRKGQSKHYSLTEKGRLQALRLATEEVDCAFQFLQELSGIVNDYAKIEEYKKGVIQSSDELEIPDVFKYYRPVIESYKNIHSVLFQVFEKLLPPHPKEELYVCVRKDGSINIKKA